MVISQCNPITIAIERNIKQALNPIISQHPPEGFTAQLNTTLHIDQPLRSGQQEPAAAQPVTPRACQQG